MRLAAVTHLSGPIDPDRIARNREPGNPYAFELFLPPNERFETFSIEPIYVGAYKGRLPRAWMVYEVETIADEQARLERLADPEFDPAEVAILESPVDGFVHPASEPSIRWLESNNNEITLEITSETAGLLVLADTFAEHFRATLDDQEVEIRRCNHAFRGVVIPAGTHTLHMWYQPRIFYYGALLSMMALSMVAVGLVRSLRMANPKASEPIVEGTSLRTQCQQSLST